MNIIIGFFLILIGGITGALFSNPISYILMFLGVFLFATISDQETFCDYIIANSNVALVRKRHYKIFIPFLIISRVLTLGATTLKIVWKEEYFKLTLGGQADTEPIKLSRKEYITLRNAQRFIYSTQPLSAEFMTNSYTVENIGFKRKKRRLIIAIIVSAVILLAAVEPTGFFLVLIYEAIFVPMIILWIPEYKDAKILQQAYDRALGNQK